MSEDLAQLDTWLNGWSTNIRHDRGSAASNADVCMCASPAACPVAADRKAIDRLRAALKELEQLREERNEKAPALPDPRGPLHQRVATEWHTVSATAHKSWTPDGYEWDHEYDAEHPDECNLLPYGQECLFDRLWGLFGLDEGELEFGPRLARAHVYGPDVNGKFEEHIEWGMDADAAPQQPEHEDGAQ